jgi:Putative MetA-pathway of phenol degradation
LTGACHALDSTWSMRDEWRPADPNRTKASLTWTRLSCAALGAVLGLLVGRGTAAAQELEPKAYSASPVGAAFLVAGLTRSAGAVVFDPTLPLKDVEAKINTAMVATGYTFGLFGKLGLVTAALPYAWGDISGLVAEEARAITRSGLADARVKLSINLAGNPAMGTREFVRAPRRTIVGASLTVTAPSGQYDSAKLINLGTNRWGFKPEVGVSVPRARWDLDASLGVWLFTRNADFFPGGLTRSQDPVVALQGHASYTFRPRLWLAVDATWYEGGDARVEDGAPAGGVNNSRLGATLSLPVGRQQSLKVAYSSGVAVRTGTDFRTVSVGWQWLWLTRP